MVRTVAGDQRHAVFRDRALERRFASDGVVAVPFLGRDAMDALRAQVAEIGLWGEAGFHDTASAELDFEQRQRLHRVLCSAFEQSAAALLADYRPVMSAIMTKWPGPGGQKEVHRDFRMVDESRFRSVCVWVPLVDVDATNGALAVLRGSHTVDTGPRSVPTTPATPDDPVPRVAFADMETVPVAVGEAVVFDLAVVHGSDENRSPQPRPAVGIAYAPRAAELSMLFCHPDDRVEQLAVPDPDVFRRLRWSERPAELSSLGFIEHSQPAVPVEELVARSREVDRDG